MDIDKMLKNIDKHFSKLTPEDIKRDVLCLNGKMTEQLFFNVMKEVKAHELIDHEDIAYHPDKYKISAQDFMDVFHYLEKALDGYLFENEDCTFPNTIGYFLFIGNFYIWDLMLGQGSSCMIKHMDMEDVPDDVKYKPISEIDTNIEFYKKLKD